MSLPVTALYAALCGIIIIVLSWLVVKGRRTSSIGRGGGDDPALQRAIRAHANFTEYVPLALILLLVAEANGIAIAVLHAAGVLLVVSRILHAWGLSTRDGRTFGRFYGTVGTWLMILLLSGIVLANQMLLLI